MKPRIELDDFALVPAGQFDTARMRQLLHDGDVRKYLCDDVLLPESTVKNMLLDSERLDCDGMGLWCIEKKDGQLAGLGGLQPMSEEALADFPGDRGVEPLIALYPAFWGKGLATSVLREFARHARSSLGLARLVAAVDAPNGKSNAMMRRGGYREIGRGNGPVHELIFYECILKNAGGLRA